MYLGYILSFVISGLRLTRQLLPHCLRHGDSFVPGEKRITKSATLVSLEDRIADIPASLAQTPESRRSSAAAAESSQPRRRRGRSFPRSRVNGRSTLSARRHSTCDPILSFGYA